MRVRALDVLAARIDGLPVQLDACTLAARTDAGGNFAWEASGWIRGGRPAILERAGGAEVLPVALETDEGALAGSALVSLAGTEGPRAAGGRLRLIGVGNLEPWPG
ncbi:MAG: hypothetical protein ACYDAN_00535 [Candidatus Limnocylindrales bacterium]